jgi:hypothetical protein
MISSSTFSAMAACNRTDLFVLAVGVIALSSSSSSDGSSFCVAAAVQNLESWHKQAGATTTVTVTTKVQ